jgi:hypothetical protein
MGLLRGFSKPKLDHSSMRRKGNEMVEPWDYEEPVAVRAIGPSAIWIRFQDGLEHELELGEIMVGPGFDALFAAGEFDQVRIGGGSIEWPSGMDIAPETLYWAKYNGKSLLKQG